MSTPHFRENTYIFIHSHMNPFLYRLDSRSRGLLVYTIQCPFIIFESHIGEDKLSITKIRVCFIYRPTASSSSSSMVSDSSSLVFRRDVRAQHTPFPSISLQLPIQDFHTDHTFLSSLSEPCTVILVVHQVHSSSDGFSLVCLYLYFSIFVCVT